jgi:hypothetical protein
VLSGAVYFYRFLLKAGPRAIIKDLERWP